MLLDSQLSWSPSTHRTTHRHLLYTRQPYMPGYSYRNYCDSALGDDFGHAYYGSNFARLRQAKEAWDKDNLFRYPQSVPPPPPTQSPYHS